MAFELGKFQTSEQRRNAKQIAQADASGMQNSSLRGQQNTSPLGMPQDFGSKVMQTAITRSAMGLGQGAAQPQTSGQAVFDQQFGSFRKEQQLKRMMERLDVPYSPLQKPIEQVTPAERARDSEAQRMAQQYGGNEMRLAIMDKAPLSDVVEERPEDLVKYYQAQRSAGQDETMKQEMINFFKTQPGFTDDIKTAEKTARMFVEQNPDVAFREFNKNIPLEVIGQGGEAQMRIKGNEGPAEAAAAGVDMSIDMNKAAMQQEFNQKVAFEPLSTARNAQFIKTDTGTGVPGMQPGSVGVPAESQGQLRSNLDWKANKEVQNLGMNLPTFDVSDPAFRMIREAIDSVKGNKGFSYDQ